MTRRTRLAHTLSTAATAHNVASLLAENADKRGDAPMFLFVERAVREAWTAGAPLAHRSITWRRLADDAARCGAGLLALGIEPGDRVVVFLPMSPALYTVLAAVQHIGAIPVVLESWIGRAHLEEGMESVAPKAVVAPEQALQMCALIPACAKIPLRISAGPSDTKFSSSLEELLLGAERASIHPVRPEDTGLITFTTGSSGTPKGANRTHAFLRAQHEAIDVHMPYGADDVDLPVFPIFCLNSAAAGVTTVLPAVDAGHPTDDDAALLALQIELHGVTSTTLNPGLLRSLARFTAERGRPLAKLRRVVVGGAPVGPSDVELCRAMAPNAVLEILYGSTEVEPICHIAGADLVEAERTKANGDGVCAGRPTPGLAVKLLAPTRDNIALDTRGFAPFEVKPGEVGEIVVAGAHVCDGYWKNEDAFARAKIRGEDGAIWHRTGDVGRFDDEGRLWIVGRVHTAVHRSGAVIFPVGVECALRALPFVRRAAYVGVPDDVLGERAVCAIERHTATDERAAVELCAVIEACRACGVPVDDVQFLDELPMDARHHSKVEVDQLRAILVSSTNGRARVEAERRAATSDARAACRVEGAAAATTSVVAASCGAASASASASVAATSSVLRTASVA